MVVLSILGHRQWALRRKRAHVFAELAAALGARAEDTRLAPAGCFFTVADEPGQPMTWQHAWRPIPRSIGRAGVLDLDRQRALRPVTGLRFRHGAAVLQPRAGILLTGLQQQRGRARIGTPTTYWKLTRSEYRSRAARVGWWVDRIAARINPRHLPHRTGEGRSVGSGASPRILIP